MKKFCLVATLFVILLSGRGEPQFSLTNYFSGEYVYYTETVVDEHSISLGFCYMNEGQSRVQNVIGESMRIDNFEPASAIKTLRAKVIKTEYIESGAVIIYAHTDLLDREVSVFNEKVNLQIAYYEDYSVIGWPLILGSF